MSTGKEILKWIWDHWEDITKRAEQLLELIRTTKEVVDELQPAKKSRHPMPPPSGHSMARSRVTLESGGHAVSGTDPDGLPYLISRNLEDDAIAIASLNQDGSVIAWSLHAKTRMPIASWKGKSGDFLATFKLAKISCGVSSQAGDLMVTLGKNSGVMLVNDMGVAILG